jgi:hypothetical protein
MQRVVASDYFSTKVVSGNLPKNDFHQVFMKKKSPEAAVSGDEKIRVYGD